MGVWNASFTVGMHVWGFMISTRTSYSYSRSQTFVRDWSRRRSGCFNQSMLPSFTDMKCKTFWCYCVVQYCESGLCRHGNSLELLSCPVGLMP